MLRQTLAISVMEAVALKSASVGLILLKISTKTWEKNQKNVRLTELMLTATIRKKIVDGLLELLSKTT